MDKADVLIEKANHDRLAAQALLNAAGVPADTAAFHIQQMIEKLIKAVLLRNGISYKPVHDLDYLLGLLSHTNADLKVWYDLTEKLSPHAVLIRYEEGYEISAEEAKSLLEEAEKMRLALLKL